MEKIKFSQLQISKEILKGVEDMGFEETTAIQTKSIPLIMEGKDVIGHSQTGTGKTAAFGIPALESIDENIENMQVLVLCPTRELAIQASDEINKYGKYKKGIKAMPIYGGQPIIRQIKALKRKPQIIVGTPGRVMDHMRRHTLKMEDLKMMVLDEADEMLNMGFREDIETILKDVPQKRQTVLFSATMSKEILKITKKYQNNPELVKVVHKKLTVPSVEQYYFEVRNNMKLDVLSRLIDMHNPKLALVFCNTKRKVDELAGQMQSRGYSAEGLHGDMRQTTRTRVMNAFRKGIIDVLIATDVAARGIDVDDIEAVFNFDVPQDEEYYVHRIGRTGRVGRVGKAFTFVSGRKEIYSLKGIQKYTNTKIHLQQIPTAKDIEELRIRDFKKEIKKAVKKEDLRKYLDIVDQIMDDDITSVDIAAAMIKMYVDKDEEVKEQEESSDVFGDTGAEPGMVRLFINVGKKDSVRPGDIVGAIAGETKMSGKLIGTVDIFDKYTFVEVPRENAREVLTIMRNNQIKGRPIVIEPAKGKDKR
ncbi:MAG: DEAD/DEAH box helicase [Bacillota bacterium]|nr:DEAD/DEAH box helicase [Bacillota bacterium]